MCVDVYKTSSPDVSRQFSFGRQHGLKRCTLEALQGGYAVGKSGPTSIGFQVCIVHIKSARRPKHSKCILDVSAAIHLVKVVKHVC